MERHIDNTELIKVSANHIENVENYVDTSQIENLQITYNANYKIPSNSFHKIHLKRGVITADNVYLPNRKTNCKQSCAKNLVNSWKSYLARNLNVNQVEQSEMPFRILVRIQNTIYDALIDTGASKLLITPKVAKGLRMRPLKNTTFIQADGTKIHAIGSVMLDIDVGQIKIKFTAIILPELSQDVIIGANFLYTFNFQCNLRKNVAIFTFGNQVTELGFLGQPQFEKVQIMHQLNPLRTVFSFKDEYFTEKQDNFQRIIVRAERDTIIPAKKTRRIPSLIEGSIPRKIKHFCLHGSPKLSFYQDCLIEDHEIQLKSDSTKLLVNIRNYSKDEIIIREKTHLADLIPIDDNGFEKINYNREFHSTIPGVERPLTLDEKIAARIESFDASKINFGPNLNASEQARFCKLFAAHKAAIAWNITQIGQTNLIKF